MPAAFAALESRVNAAVIDRLSNRTAAYTAPGGGAARDVDGIFDAHYATDLESLAGDSTPAFTCSTDTVSDATRGAHLTVGLEVFEVVEVMPDGAGLTVLRLRSV
jgi:hypothetical protein